VLQLPDIVSAAAVGVPDLAAGEAIHVFVTLHAKAKTTPEAVIAYCREKLSRHMVPKVVTIIKRMPLNPHGKVIKAELCKMALDALDAQLR
jgi:acyl-CoA synthetase (AMP-forming)/AMP-acid ligase II